ncbi:flagellar outer arm,Dynein light chain LC6 [Trichinella spiralis]
MADRSNTSFENRELAKHVRVVDSDMPTKVIMASAKIGLWALKRKINVEEISKLIVDIFSKTTKDSSWGCIVGKNVVLGTEFFGMYFMHFIIDDYTFFVFHKRNVY